MPFQPDLSFQVKVFGQVKRPGAYPFSSNLKLNTLLDATSLNDSEYRKTMNPAEYLFLGRNPNGEDPIKALTNLKDNILIENGDTVNISKLNNFQQIETVSILGEVTYPNHTS